MKDMSQLLQATDRIAQKQKAEARYIKPDGTKNLLLC